MRRNLQIKNRKELSVVFYVIRDVKKIAEENRVERVESVTLEIGEVSGVLHEYLIDCWNWAVKKEPLMEHAILQIEHTYLLQGNEFNIKEIGVT